MVTRLESGVAVRVARPEDEAAWPPRRGRLDARVRISLGGRAGQRPLLHLLHRAARPRLIWWRSWTAGWPANPG